MKSKPFIALAEPGRRERRRIETREKLYRTAMELFAKHGFFQTTTEAITEAADVGQGTFFNYFPTKSHVLFVVFEKQLQKITAATAEAEAGKVPIREVLERFIHSIVEELSRSPALARSLLTAFSSEDEARSLVAETLVKGRNGLAQICVLGQKRGEIRKGCNPADLALAFQRSVLGTLLIWAMQSEISLHAWLGKAMEDFWFLAGADHPKKHT